MKLQAFDFYEIDEAFASQVLCTLTAWQDPVFCRERLGLGAAAGRDRPGQAERARRLARGRTVGVTGGRIVAGLAKTLNAARGGHGLISICAAGGLGVVATMEAPG